MNSCRICYSVLFVKSYTMYVNGKQRTNNIPPHMNFGKYLLANLRLKNHEIALENGETNEKLSYKDLTQNAVNYSIYLKRLGIGKGDTVAIGSEKRIEIVQTIIAVLFTGATSTTLYLTCGRADFRHKMTVAEPKYLICSKLFWTTYKDILENFTCIENILTFDEEFESVASIKNMVTIDEDVNKFEPSDVHGRIDTALILYSSGTTGMPKGVQLTHFNCIINSLPDEYNEASLQTGFIFGEWYHNYDIFMTFKFLSAGKKMVFVTNVSPESFLQCVENCQVDIAFVGPTFIMKMTKLNNNKNYNTETLKIIYSRSNPLSSKIIDKIKERFPKLQNVLQGYGMTEAGELTSEIWQKHDYKVGSVGVVSPGYTLKVVDIDTRKILGKNERGEICLKSPAFMKGYIGVDSSAYLDEEGFFNTGDLGYYDEDKYFYIVDRLKELIVYDGQKFPPIQLETLLLLHPSVCDAGVVGKPVVDYGEEPTAFVVKQHGSDVTESDLLDYVASEVPQHMQLRGGIIFIEEIPRSPRGKILRQNLRNMLQEFYKQ